MLGTVPGILQNLRLLTFTVLAELSVSGRINFLFKNTLNKWELLVWSLSLLNNCYLGMVMSFRCLRMTCQKWFFLGN